MSRVLEFSKVAICNRGEVAVRIIIACRELGLKTVLLHSDPDVETRAYRMADECVNLKGESSAESYLDIEKNIKAAKKVGADAIHPGFGFLSENADFAQRAMEEGIVFVGPMPDSIRLMGDKVSAKKRMEESGVPCIPGYKEADQSPDRLAAEAEKIGFPVLIKAAAGGGGRGMKVARSLHDFMENLDSACREAQSAFGSKIMFLEKYLENTKHIEFQIFADNYGNTVHLFERECSVQRRHQKIIEEAPSPSLSPALREKMAEAAVKAARAANYIGAGTVEFLLKGEDFYFLEMNTRLQVEHPVTEYVTGTDLVVAQLRVAQGHPLEWNQSDIKLVGHSIECRLYAENPHQMGMPSTGQILFQEFPHGPGRRFEYGFEAGDTVSSFYDPMIAKIICHSEDRSKAISKMQSILCDSVIFGVHTNIEFLKQILAHPEFMSGEMDTGFIADYFASALGEKHWTVEEIERAKVLFRTAGSSNAPESGLWDQAWRLV